MEEKSEMAFIPKSIQQSPIHSSQSSSIPLPSFFLPNTSTWTLWKLQPGSKTNFGPLIWVMRLTSAEHESRPRSRMPAYVGFGSDVRIVSSFSVQSGCHPVLLNDAWVRQAFESPTTAWHIHTLYWHNWQFHRSSIKVLTSFFLALMSMSWSHLFLCTPETTEPGI